MNPTIALAGNDVATRETLVTRRTGRECLVLTLVALGIVASMAALVSYEETISQQLKPGDIFVPDLVKSRFYYAVYGIELVLFTAAGLTNPDFGLPTIFMDPRRAMVSVRLNLGK